jgi:hypothetical protein
MTDTSTSRPLKVQDIEKIVQIEPEQKKKNRVEQMLADVKAQQEISIWLAEQTNRLHI